MSKRIISKDVSWLTKNEVCMITIYLYLYLSIYMSAQISQLQDERNM